jgi:hypothetical protein
MPELYCIKYGLLSAVFFLGAILVIVVSWLEIKANLPKKQVLNKRVGQQ